MEQKDGIIFSLEELDAIIEQLIKKLSTTTSIMTFAGPLGAGKTTLIRALLQKFGVTEIVTSPTFTYVNLYENDQGKIFYHFDLYRMKRLNDFIVHGFDEYLADLESISFIEWPEVIKPLLEKHKVCAVTIDYYGEDKRILRVVDSV